MCPSLFRVSPRPQVFPPPQTTFSQTNFLSPLSTTFACHNNSTGWCPPPPHPSSVYKHHPPTPPCFKNNHAAYVSLAESEKWIKETLIGSLEDVEKGTALFKRFRPSFIRAFNDAADLGKDRKITNSASTDDYVQQHEFRVFNAYLCL